MKIRTYTSGSGLGSFVTLILLAVIAHFAFSSLGFSPTDDGLTLSGSRRIADGQVPHLDFVLIRPALSPLMHVPLIWFGGNYTYLTSRLIVWLQFALMAWLWVGVVEFLSGWRLSEAERILLATICGMFSAHNFPIMAWHTIDGLFLISVGLAMATRARKPVKMLGYALIGAACLCKQGFVFLGPVALLAFDDWRRRDMWLAWLAPGVGYVALLLATGAWSDAVTQLLSQHDLMAAGIRPLLTFKVFGGMVAGFGAMQLLRTTAPGSMAGRRTRSTVALLLFAVPLIFQTVALSAGTAALKWSYFLFGSVLGVVLQTLISQDGALRRLGKAGWMGLAMAWCAALSLGYNAPVLAAGQLAIILIMAAWGRQGLRAPTYRRLVSALLLTGMVMPSFVWARRHHIYQDRPAHQLTHSLDGVLPGGYGIRTNSDTYAFMLDLRDVATRLEDSGHLFAIMPDCAGYWARARTSNPLPVDWHYWVELNNSKIIHRVTDALDTLQGRATVILQKVNTFSPQNGFTPLSVDRFPSVEHVRSSFHLVGESKYFEIRR